MNIRNIGRTFILASQFVKRWSDILAFCTIFLIITMSSISLLESWDKLGNRDIADFFQYYSRHEAVRKSIIEYHTFPMRSHWFGGGFPTLADPEDPSLNPLLPITLLFGPVKGLKIIPFLAILISGLATYALARYVLNYTKWGALFSGLMFGTSLFVPLRVFDGNPNEVYAAFLPLIMLLTGLAYRRKKSALLILPFVFYTMLSDGKLTAFMAIFYLGILCFLDLIPVFNTFGSGEQSGKINHRPLKILFLMLSVTFLIGMIRFLPALELINAKGGLGNIDLVFRPETYRPEGVFACTFRQLWQEIIGWRGSQGLATIGWLPVILFAIALPLFWRKSLPALICLLVFAWLLLAHNAPFNLLKLMWKLPVFSAVYRPYKYFSFQIVFTFALASGQFFWLLRKLRPKWLEHICAIILIITGLWFLYPKMANIQRKTYGTEISAELLVPEEMFYQVKGKGIARDRSGPLRSITYINLLRNVGTIDWYTGIPIDENAVPKYFVDAAGNYIPNPEYRGEVFFSEVAEESSLKSTAKAEFRPNSITVQADIQIPGILIINQNYHRDWHTDRGKLLNVDGLIGLRLEETGSYNIHLRYISRSFCAGLVVSLLSLAMLAFVCWAYATKRLLDWSDHGSTVIRHISRGILWLIN